MPRTPLTPRRLRRWYRSFNRRFFDGELPTRAKLKLATAPDHRGWVDGEDRDRCVVHISPEYYWDTGYGRLTLLHEMVHIKLWPYAGHGPQFQCEMQRLAAAGAMKGLW